MGHGRDLEKFIDEAVENIREDRATIKYLLLDLLEEIKKGDTSQKETGMIAAKYVETLQRSNEQLVKVAVLIQKKTKDSDGLTLEDKKEIFELIKADEVA